jgi:hypothetical protein
MEETISLYRHAIGPRFARHFSKTKGAWFAGFGFYWFCVMFYRKCGPEMFQFDTSFNWTGIVFCWSLNPTPNFGDLIWLKSKKWGVYA